MQSGLHFVLETIFIFSGVVFLSLRLCLYLQTFSSLSLYLTRVLDIAKVMFLSLSNLVMTFLPSVYHAGLLDDIESSRDSFPGRLSGMGSAGPPDPTFSESKPSPSDPNLPKKKKKNKKHKHKQKREPSEMS